MKEIEDRLATLITTPTEWVNGSGSKESAKFW